MISIKTYYTAVGAMRIGSTVYYILKDHLGSASVVTETTPTASIWALPTAGVYRLERGVHEAGTMFTDNFTSPGSTILGPRVYRIKKCIVSINGMAERALKVVKLPFRPVGIAEFAL